jgi:integrase
MKGYLEERHGSYLIRVSMGKDSETKKYRQYTETVKTTSKPLAEKRLREVLIELDKGIFIRPTKLTLGEYLSQWLTDYCEPNLSERAVEAYRYNIDAYICPKLGHIPLKSLQPAQIQRLYSDLLKKGHRRTAKYCHQTLHRALRIAFKQGIVSRNVTDACEVPKLEDKEARFLNESEAVKFLEAARQTPYSSMAYLFLTAGLRRSELLALRWSDINLEDGRLSVTRSLHQLGLGDNKGKFIFKSPKSKKSLRIIPLPSSTVQVMKEEYQAQLETKKALGMDVTPDDLVFSHLIDGSPLRPDSVSHAFARIAKGAGLSEAHLHTLRHSYGSVLIKQGIHLKVIQELMGHSSVKVTGDIYSHILPGQKEAAVKNFDGFLTNRKALLPA